MRSAHRRARRLRPRCSPTCWRRSSAPAPLDEIVVVSGEPRVQTLRGERGRDADRRPRGEGPVTRRAGRPGPRGGPRLRSRAARSRRLPARGSGRARPAGARLGRPGRGDRAGPPRRRHERAAARSVRPVRAEVRARARLPATWSRATRRACAASSRRSPHSVSTSTRPTTLISWSARWATSTAVHRARAACSARSAAPAPLQLERRGAVRVRGPGVARGATRRRPRGPDRDRSSGDP